MIRKKLKDTIALVAGGTRGAGRGISVALGEAGATVYITGRSTKNSPSEMKRSETIEETAELVNAAGGIGIAVRTDHSDSAEVRRLFERIDSERGRLDLLVNDVWGGDPLVDWSKKFWEHSLEDGLKIQRSCLDPHLITNYFAAPLMIRNRSGLVLEITDGIDYRYRGNVYYTLIKSSIINLASSIAEELKPFGIAALALTPGFLRSEAMLDHFGVDEKNWKDGCAKDPHFIASETPLYIGRAVAALASDPNILAKTGKAFSTWKLSEEFDFVDADGTRPHWGNYFFEKFGERL
ncbi:SDR family NAD(P)-dependent oxidoreductase [Leptospira gomenensis]|uniref:SDR family NAD(P)-dependent oxidoreductase n=1 Tax=Leptospira gomenensis TaxID=2484974 RepID=A0A5F1Y6K4_9LEPT|nr:SDR family oxidoreductase [Leptospira gomenensis]TGK28950.1 SDR family NAD(P)-dependent oxidoreductase [Leptospira gomenensis]TGK35411.1 SDR family NAD(P)-dependent oxidoreductase [Leptospira gomenensis]TGK40709.1 SDR family NAD(P)-dependent oxidoreductase [Leptospira gomenensis]TGK68447.1 SDR family NAD(P)-dependent oxidoreductase [Leptospira gomenensis]